MWHVAIIESCQQLDARVLLFRYRVVLLCVWNVAQLPSSHFKLLEYTHIISSEAHRNSERTREEGKKD